LRWPQARFLDPLPAFDAAVRQFIALSVAALGLARNRTQRFEIRFTHRQLDRVSPARHHYVPRCRIKQKAYERGLGK
jgi:hypothetical protein